MSEARLQLADARQAAQAYPIPGLSEAACARRYTFLARDGVIPPGVAIRLGKRVFFDLNKLGRFLAGGGSRRWGISASRP
jgi:hypothetical protein